jgi:N-acetylglucosaminyl-diphospho-decaprenol L-rhamnosyltransferase
MSGPEITVSVISHRQNALINALIQDIRRHCAARIALVLTENVPDSTLLQADELACPVQQVSNPSPKGFGSNHNAAFAVCETPFFCVLNPDIRLNSDPFPPLLETAGALNVAAVAPLVRSPSGMVEDSARRYPTLGSLLLKFFTGTPGLDYAADRGPIDVDWVAGMFILFRSDAFAAIRGFDERYFLYYEDVDICFRLRATGRRVIYDPRAQAVHDAQRASRRNPRLALHHLTSIARFLRRR